MAHAGHRNHPCRFHAQSVPIGAAATGEQPEAEPDQIGGYLRAAYRPRGHRMYGQVKATEISDKVHGTYC
jgi:hypothetical protein